MRVHVRVRVHVHVHMHLQGCLLQSYKPARNVFPRARARKKIDCGHLGIVCSQWIHIIREQIQSEYL